jgi:hypothetical protein
MQSVVAALRERFEISNLQFEILYASLSAKASATADVAKSFAPPALLKIRVHSRNSRKPLPNPCPSVFIRG